MLSTLLSPTIVLSIPETVPVNVGSAMGALSVSRLSSCPWIPEVTPSRCAISASLTSPIEVVEGRDTVPLNVGSAFGASGAIAVAISVVMYALVGT